MDEHFDFDYADLSQLTFSEDHVVQQLSALCAYYAYLIIGINLDSFAPLGGTDVLQCCLNTAHAAQALPYKGWESFANDKSRFAFINDYMDERLRPFRQLQYAYYRTGLDQMSQQVEKARVNISAALTNLLSSAHQNRPNSLLPQLWTDYKRDELAAIYDGKGTTKEKEQLYSILFSINASQSGAWESIKR